jgi:gamma-glutamyl:cysteine ligase YbdK (ATP-grasp superfamily)
MFTSKDGKQIRIICRAGHSLSTCEDKPTNERKNKRTNERTNERTKEQTNERNNERGLEILRDIFGEKNSSKKMRREAERNSTELT